MACPHFQAAKPRGQTDSSHAAFLPLGDAWDGVCGAAPELPWQPDETTLLTQCNMGYARATCPRFPAGTEADAARFSLMEDDGALLRVAWVLERDHHPLAHGTLQFHRTGAAFEPADAGPTVTRLARHYVDSYLRRKAEASGL